MAPASSPGPTWPITTGRGAADVIGRFGLIARRSRPRVVTQVTRTETSQADFLTGTLTNVNAYITSGSLLLDYGNYSVKYEADAVPSASTPAWVKNNGGGASESVTSGVLRVQAPSAGDYMIYARENVVVEDNVTIVECLVKVAAHSATSSAQIGIRTVNRRIAAMFHTDKIVMDDGVSTTYNVDMMTSYRTVRLVKNGATGWSLYVDGALVLSGTGFGSADGTNRIVFGHVFSGSTTSDVYWDYVYYSTSTTHAASGNRTWPSLDLSNVVTATDSVISWTATTPANTALTVETSLDSGTNWSPATNGAAVPGISPGDSLIGKSLLVRQNLSTTAQGSTPQLDDLTVTVNGAV